MSTETTRPVPATHLSWLREEMQTWRAESLVSDQQADAILGRYHGTRRVDLSRLVLTVGGCFVGVGVIWLVAANIDELPPLLRFAAVALWWVAATVGAEWLAGRREHSGSIPSPVVKSARLLAALLFGAVIFQAAQSLQVPAYEPSLVGYWALGALVYAYGVGSVAPLVVGVVAGGVWLTWQVLQDAPSPLAGVLAVLTAGVLAVSIASLHDTPRSKPWLGFDELWRVLGAVALLGALFVAALPFISSGDYRWTPWLTIAVAVSLVAAFVATGLATRARNRLVLTLEPLGAVAIALVAVSLVLWDAGSSTEDLGAGDWAHAILAVGFYLVAAAAIAVMGVLRDNRGLTLGATAALVLFTTVQSFSVFAAIIEGAWLFLVIGMILLGTGYLADRARRQLTKTLDAATTETTATTEPTEESER